MDGGTVGCDTLLEETFYIFSKKNTVYKVKLTEKGLSLVKESNGQTKTETIRIDDIVGAHCLRSKRKSSGGPCVCGPNPKKKDLKVVDDYVIEQDQKDVSAYLYVYAYVLKKPKVTAGERREKMTITLRFRSFDKPHENMREAQRWRATIKCLIRKRPVPGSLIYQGEQGIIASPTISLGDTQRLLILLNPKSGPGRAKEMFQGKIAPILNEAEISYDLFVTKHPNYARDFVRLRDIYQWSGIVAVGGDGILFEVINGVFERPDWENVLSEIGFGVIPCGSGNGLAKAIAHSLHEPYNKNPYLTSTLNVISGNCVNMDIVRVETKKEIMFSFLSIGWGLLADIDIESEKLRAIGSQRFSIWSVAKLLGLRTYRGKLMFLRIDGLKNVVKEETKLNRSYSHNDSLDYNSKKMHTSQSLNDVLSTVTEDNIDLETDSHISENGFSEEFQRTESFYSVNSQRSTFFSVACSSYMSVDDPVRDKIEPRKPGTQIRMYGPASRLPSLTQPVPSNWECVEGDFVMVQASYQTHIGSDCFIVPSAKLSDGIIWLMFVRGGASRSQMLQILLGLSSGGHVTSPQLEVIPVKAFRIEPDMSESNYGHITVDGECVDYGPIQAEIFPNLANIMSRTPPNPKIAVEDLASAMDSEIYIPCTVVIACRARNLPNSRDIGIVEEVSEDEWFSRVIEIVLAMESREALTCLKEVFPIRGTMKNFAKVPDTVRRSPPLLPSREEIYKPKLRKTRQNR